MLSMLTLVVAAAPALAAPNAPAARERGAVEEVQPGAELQRVAAPSRAAPSRARSSGECVAVEVVEGVGDRGRVVSRSRGRRLPPVSVAKTVDLQLQVRIRPVLRDDHVLRLELLTPRGYLYQTMTLPFRFASGRELRATPGQTPTRSIAGFPRPLEVQLLTSPRRRRPTADRVTARLPVAGTSIAMGSLFGEWKAVPYIDDQAAPCGPAGSFVIAE